MISIIAAIGRNRELGRNGQLLWRIPDDLKRFRALTTGHPIIMGRKTFDSIGRPLPNRTNIVVTRDANWNHEGVAAAHSLEGAIEIAQGRQDFQGPTLQNTALDSESDSFEAETSGTSPRSVLGEPELRTVLGEDSNPIFIIGGAQIYEQALPLAHRLYLTLIDDSKEADTFFPEYENLFTKKTFEESREWEGLKYRWIDLEKSN